MFRYYSDVLEEETVETMWATIVDDEKGLYKIDSISFYGPSVASDDIIFAEYDESELMVTYRETIHYSGNSIIQVVLMNDEVEINNIRKIFEDLDCLSERLNDKYFAMEVLAEKDYKVIKEKLSELESEGIIGYAEPCLSETHRY
ncbi:MAG: DUF4265 domain-containing protein [Mucilaginibacter sp.]